MSPARLSAHVEAESQDRGSVSDHEVFISYAHEDKARAGELASLIAQRGFTVWWDESRLQTGDVFTSKIERAIAIARATVVCWSGAALHSDWVKFEAALALDRSTLLPI